MRKKKPPRKFSRGTLVKGSPFTGTFVQYSMIGIILKESNRSNWWGENYTRWYWILAENGKLVEEVERYIEAV